MNQIHHPKCAAFEARIKELEEKLAESEKRWDEWRHTPVGKVFENHLKLEQQLSEAVKVIRLLQSPPDLYHEAKAYTVSEEFLSKLESNKGG